MSSKTFVEQDRVNTADRGDPGELGQQRVAIFRAELLAKMPGSFFHFAKALDFAQRAHESIGQVRKYTGEPYFVHPMSVCLDLIATREKVQSSGASLSLSDSRWESMLCACLLHDVVEDTPVSLSEIQDAFGLDVSQWVDELTDQFSTESHPDWNRKTRKMAESLRLGLASIEAQIIKLCDLYDNGQSIAAHDPGFARVYLQEKRQILAHIQRPLSGDSLGPWLSFLLDRAQSLLGSQASGAAPDPGDPDESSEAIFRP